MSDQRDADFPGIVGLVEQGAIDRQNYQSPTGHIP